MAALAGCKRPVEARTLPPTRAPIASLSPALAILDFRFIAYVPYGLPSTNCKKYTALQWLFHPMDGSVNGALACSAYTLVLSACDRARTGRARNRADCLPAAAHKTSCRPNYRFVASCEASVDFTSSSRSLRRAFYLDDCRNAGPQPP
jgi:hypothetical protein